MKKTEANILVIDDDEDVLISARLLLKQQYTNIITRNNPREINRLISTQDIDLILLDMNYRTGYNDGKEGMYWLKHILGINPETAIVLMTAFGEVTLAVEAIKEGAFDFILKPWNNEKLLATVRSALELKQSKHKIKVLKSTQKGNFGEANSDETFVAGQSAIMQNLMLTVKKISATPANVLIYGENGTGKEQMARKIHQLSDRSNQVFVHVDLGALAGTLFESELFGHRKGAFTGAIEDKMGRFEMAKGGTLFLDEVGNLPLDLQTKLLTVLQARKVTRIGEGIERQVDARFIFATNVSLPELVREGKFREDLMYRINTIEIEIPPLRKRKEDIPEFIDHFMAIYRRKYKKSELSVSDETLNLLTSHTWPGNIRELQHAIERGVILSDGLSVKASDIQLKPGPGQGESHFLPDNLNLQEIEMLLIQKALEKHKGNITKAARDLGLTRAALYRRMEKYEL